LDIVEDNRMKKWQPIAKAIHNPDEIVGIGHGQTVGGKA